MAETLSQPATHHPRTIRAARAIAEALFCSDAGPAPSDRIEWLLGEIDVLLTRAGWRSGGFYKLGVFGVWLLAPLLIGRLPGLGRLPLTDRVRALTKMERSGLAVVVLGVKAIMCLMYYEHPDAVVETGHASECQRVAS